MTIENLKVGDRMKLDLNIDGAEDAVGTIFEYPSAIGGALVFWDSGASESVRHLRYCLPSILKVA
jgi:hypothetical protein